MNSKDKGKRGELDAAKVLREYGYSNAKRSVQYCGANGDADIIDALPGIHIEVKRTETLRLYDALAQAKHDAKNGELPIVMHRKNNCDWVVIQPLDGWMQMYKEARG